MKSSLRYLGSLNRPCAEIHASVRPAIARDPSSIPMQIGNAVLPQRAAVQLSRGI
jgi:hypothetical protein